MTEYLRGAIRATLLASIVACGAARGPVPEHVTPSATDAGADAADTQSSKEAAAPAAPVESAPVTPSTASFEEATSTPESVDFHDQRAQLTDNQLSEPMRGVLIGCRVPPSVRVTIQTAVQNGRAIGVTVHVEPPKPKPLKKGQKKPSKKALKAQADLVARITKCADQAVRARKWPPSSRRDSFTTSF